MGKNLNSARIEAVKFAQAKLALRPVYLDTETTGIGLSDEIIEICVIDHDSNVLINSLIKPIGPISFDAERIHGITTSMLHNSPRWLNVWQAVQSVINERFVAIYNAEFDIRLLKQTHHKSGMLWKINSVKQAFCVMKLYAQFYGDWNEAYGNYRWQSLDSARQQCGIDLPITHRAKDDALLTRAVLHHIANQKK